MAQAMAPTATTDCDILMRVFLHADGVAPAARQLVVEGLPHALRVNHGEPHAFQSQFIAIVADMLSELSRDTEQKQGTHKATLELLEKQVEEVKAAYAAAKKAMGDATLQAQEMAEQLKDCEEATKLTQVEHEQVLQEKNLVDEHQNELETLKVALTSTFEGPFQLLMDGQCDAGHIEIALEAVGTLLKKIGTEPALVAAAAKALGNKPAARGEFDLLTLSCVKQILETEMNKIDTLIADHQPKWHSVMAEQLGLWALLDHERARAQDVCTSARTVELSLKSAQDVCTSAQKESLARSEAVSHKLCEQVIMDNMARELVSARETVARLAAFCYEAADTSTADTVETLDVSMAAATA